MANSTITLTASMRSNLMSLKNIATQMSKTQNILSTGKKVNSAIDNASSYYQARSLSNRAADLNALLDTMGQGIQTLQAANEGIEAATSYLEQAKAVIEQASSTGATPLTSQVQLTDNVEELLAQGYIAIDSSMTGEDIMNLIAELDADGEEINLVLTEDIEIDDYFEFYEADVTINGAGHTLKLTNEWGQLYLGGENTTIENMTIEHTGNSDRVIYSETTGLTLRNVNINHEYTGNYSAQTVYMECGGTVENVNINTKAESVLAGVLSYSGDLDIKNLTMDLSIEKKGSVTGVYAGAGYDGTEGGNVTVDGMSINAHGENIKGLWAAGEVTGLEGVYSGNSSIPQSLTNGKANTQAIVAQLGSDAKAAYATTQFYVGDKNGEFGQGKWYLPSIAELMDLYGTDYDGINGGYGISGANGDNLSAINTTLGELADDGIAEEMDGWYWSSSEFLSNYSWLLLTSDGSRNYSNKHTNGYSARAFRLVENCFNPSLLSGAEGDGIPKVGDIMYLDKSWGTLEDYDSSKADQVAGVICGVGDDGSVRVVSLKDLTFSSLDDAGIFNPDDPYGGSTKYVRWATYDNGKWEENIEAITDVDDAALAAAFNQLKGISVEAINNAFTKVDVDTYKEQFNDVISQYDDLIKDASYQGVNLLTGGELNVVFNETRTHSFNVKGEDIRSDKLGLKTVSWNNAGELEVTVESLKNAINKLRSVATDLGNKYTIIQTRQNFTEALTDVLETGADDLVLADMNETSAEYLMLQTRQQLAINSLSLASQSASSILSLF